MTDIEISRASDKKRIVEVAKEIGLKKKDLSLYGDYKAKILKQYGKIRGKLVLVTAISPTPFGEGKTTVSIGLADALHHLGHKVVAALREPSMGPVFGMKGGATGGGYSQVVPMDDINLHFTGDFHAITSANNLICAAIDSHIFFGNELDIKTVTFHRCLDVNDRALRNVQLGEREEEFSISSASEIMALFCLAKDLDDLRESTRTDSKRNKQRKQKNLERGENEFFSNIRKSKRGSLVALLKDAIHPNLVQTLENTPVIIHGGPFANIAHGCSSIMGTRTALSQADYVITEAGFGADLGAEKFFDIKCRVGNLVPDSVVLVVTIKALKYHGGVKKDDIYTENMEALRNGFANLDKHYDNLRKFGVNVVVCLNKYHTDLDEEIEELENHCKEKGYDFSISNAYSLGGEGAIDLANEIIKLKNKDFHYLYQDNESIVDKIFKVCHEIYGASKVNYSEEAMDKIYNYEKNGMSHLPICVAKTQYSFSDDAKKVGVPEDFEVTVRDVNLYAGAGFITVLLGNIMTMPGLSRRPNYELIDVIDGNIVNLS